ncbi:MAG TPA: endopeptidase La [Candidatus Anaerobiospirillum stercoravium]|nr:endopeptidase La [Candidatus Anaerobiospirillum stercoravium]
MANLDDVKTMLVSLLKAGSPKPPALEETSKDAAHNVADGFDPDNLLAHTDLYRDEQGNLLPSKLLVVPLMGHPVLPAQLSTVQLSISWLDIITEVISSSHHTFALFNIDESAAGKKSFSLEDLPKVGTVVRLMSARSTGEDIDLIVEGVRRVSIIEHDPVTNWASVRYPEIEYRLANPTLKDKLFANTQALRDSLTRSVEFEKKIAALRQERFEYARDIGIELEPVAPSPAADSTPNLAQWRYVLTHDDKRIGCLSKAKLKTLFEFLGLGDLSPEAKERIAINLARPSQLELDKLNEYNREINDLLSERSAQLMQDWETLAPKSRELAASLLSPSERELSAVKSVLEASRPLEQSSSSTSAPAAADEPTEAKTEAQVQSAAQPEAPGAAQDPSESADQPLSALTADFLKLLKAERVRSASEDEAPYVVADSLGHKAPEAEADDAQFLSAMSALLDAKSTQDQGSRRDELFALIAKVGRQEEKDTQQAVKDFTSKAVAGILEQTPKEQDLEAPVTGPNIGFINDDTAVVTFMPGRESSEDLLLRLNEIQKEHEQQLRRDAAASKLIAQVDDVSGAALADDDAPGASGGFDILGDQTNEDGSTETRIVIDGDKPMSPDLKELLSYLMQGKDLSQIALSEREQAESEFKDQAERDQADYQDSEAKSAATASGDAAEASAGDSADKTKAKALGLGRNDKWGALQRAAMIRSKLAALLGGKVIFGVSNLDENQEGAQRALELRAYSLGITLALQELVPNHPLITEEIRQYLAHLNMSDPSVLADCAAALTSASNEELQQVLDTVPVLPRAKLSFELITRDLAAVKLQDKIRTSVVDNIQKRQKDYFLREQLNEIKKELGLVADEKDLDVEKFKERMAKLNPPEHIKARFEDEIAKLSLLETASPEYGVTRNYIDILTTIPWGKKAKDLMAQPEADAAPQDETKDEAKPEAAQDAQADAALAAKAKAEAKTDSKAEANTDADTDAQADADTDAQAEADTDAQAEAKTDSKAEAQPEAKESFDLERARAILDEDHEGLQDVKDRIIEFLAVGALKGETSGQIMLFVGPPGVGKTSIGKSIARALGRPFYRLSLGGIDDVSEIKGHRKTYVGAMPGKIVAALRETKVMNPVIMLDEIDKLGKSYHGDPDSALLETLDPEQNKNFLDVYLDEKLDLSGCLFICTANGTETISPPLLDRMDPIRLSGYIAKEKFAIAQKHLIPRAYEAAGIKPKSRIKIPDETITSLIEGYARESGVRSLERAIAKLIRKAAVKLVEGKSRITIKPGDLEAYLGTAPFRREKMLQGVGIMTGLAWTSVGGATLPVESIVTNHDSAGFKLTGSLGDVMKESANIAYSFMQSHLGWYADLKQLAARDAAEMELLYGPEEPEAEDTDSNDGNNGKSSKKPRQSLNFFANKTVHLHVPEGAIPKDGPSAGVTMATSLLSLALNEAPKSGYAMTGELTLTGHVLPIGGLREKVIAARRMGIFNLIVPIGNEGDVKELPEQVKSGVTFTYADTFNDVAYTLFDDVKERLKLRPNFTAPKSEHFKVKPEAEGAKAPAAKQPVTKKPATKAKTSVAELQAETPQAPAIKKPAVKAKTVAAQATKKPAAKTKTVAAQATKKPAAKTKTVAAQATKKPAAKTAPVKAKAPANKAVKPKAGSKAKPAGKAEPKVGSKAGSKAKAKK